MRMRILNSWQSKFAGLTYVFWLSHPAIGAELLTTRDLSLSLGVEAATKAIESCTTSGFSVSVTVLDRQGVAKVTLRGDRAVPQASDTSSIRRSISLRPHASMPNARHPAKSCERDSNRSLRSPLGQPAHEKTVVMRRRWHWTCGHRAGLLRPICIRTA
jgi:hypothetical protein